MPSHKAPGFSEIPADLFKKAPTPFQKRIHLLVNEILIGDHECDTGLLMAKVILIHKNKDIAILDHYRPIALLNTIYQLIMLIITSRLRQLTEYYAVMEGSQYGFRTHRGVQMVVQRAHWDRNLCQDSCFLQWVTKIVKSKILHCKKAWSNNDMSLLQCVKETIN